MNVNHVEKLSQIQAVLKKHERTHTGEKFYVCSVGKASGIQVL
jgi:hypothetical protein